MSDLRKIWNDIPESPLSEKEIEEVMNRKSKSEIERFKRVLKLEIYISCLLLLPLWLVSSLLKTEIIVLVGSIVIVGCLLNLFTLRRLKQLELFEDLKHFLERCINALKAFVIAFLFTAQVVGLFAITFVKSWKAEEQGWGEWLSSSDGLLIVLLLIVINTVLISYAWVFYIRRIRSLASFLREISVNC